MVTNTSDKPQLLTVGEAADLIHVHINTIRRWADSGIIKSFRVGARGDRRFIREDVQKLLVTDAPTNE